MSTNQTPSSVASPEVLRPHTAHADSKVGILLGANLAGLGFVLTQVAEGSLLIRVPLGIAGLMQATALIFLLVVIYPRAGSSEFGTTVAAGDPQDTNAQANDLQRIVCLKFHYVQYAIKMMGAAVFPTAVAIITSVLS